MLTQIQPFIRVSHDYEFPPERNGFESHRFGYCYALHLGLEGSGQLTVGNVQYPIRSGSLVIVPPLVEHSFASDARSPLKTGNIYCELWNDKPVRTHKHLAWSYEEIEWKHVTPRIECEEIETLPLVLSLQRYPDLIALFRKISDRHQEDDPLSAKIAEHYLSGMIMEICRTTFTESAYDYRIQKLLDAVRRSDLPERDSDWAAYCGLKKTRFHERFKAVTGLSPHAYRLKKRMERAAAYLLESHMPITEIAELLGYPAIHPFSRQFAQHFGVSPSVYRNRQQ